MIESLPFDDWLRDVERIRGRERVDIGEYLALQKLLRSYDGISARELRDAMVAVVARTATEAEAIAVAFDQRYRNAPAQLAEAAGTVEPAPTSPRPNARLTVAKPSRIWTVTGAVVAGVLLLFALITKTGVGPLNPFPPAHPSASEDPISPPPPTPSAGPSPSALPEKSSASRLTFWPPSNTAIATGAGLTLLGLTWFCWKAGRHRVRRWQAQRWQAFTELPGPRDYRTKSDLRHRVRPHALEMMTGLLESLAGKLQKSPRIDVAATVRETARRAAVTMVHEPATASGRILVLRDVGQPMLPWRTKIDRFIADLQRETVVELLYFERDPTLVSPVSGRRGRPLREWVAYFGGLPLLILSDARFLLQPAVTPTFLRQAFEPWPLRVVLHPLERPEQWPAGLSARDAALSAFPMSNAGYRALLRWLPSRARDTRSRMRPAAPPLWPGDVLRLRGMLSFLPQPSFQLAELLRSELLPDTPDSILLTLDCVLFPNEGSDELEQARTWLRTWFAQAPQDFEAYERFWDELVPEPPAGTAAYQRYMRDRALMRLRLSPTVTERELLDMAAVFADSPLADDWNAELARQGRTLPRRSAARQRATRLIQGTAAAASNTEVGRRPRPWGAPSKWAAALTVLGGFAVLPLGARVSDPKPVSPPPSSSAPPPTCDVGSTRCGEHCVDLTTDAQNCGYCDKNCPPGLACQNGTCACTPPLSNCSGSCVDLQTNAGSCGACGKPCAAPATCVAGRCEPCRTGLSECAPGKCVSLQTDAQNCGACGTNCGVAHASRACVGGACQAPVCAKGFANCDGRVRNGCEVELQSDANNCGACGKICPPLSPRSPSGTCRAGQCAAPPPPTCEKSCETTHATCLKTCVQKTGEQRPLGRDNLLGQDAPDARPLDVRAAAEAVAERKTGLSDVAGQPPIPRLVLCSACESAKTACLSKCSLVKPSPAAE